MDIWSIIKTAFSTITGSPVGTNVNIDTIGSKTINDNHSKHDQSTKITTTNNNQYLFIFN